MKQDVDVIFLFLKGLVLGDIINDALKSDKRAWATILSKILEKNAGLGVQVLQTGS